MEVPFMAKSLNTSVLDKCNLRSDATWNALYPLLVAQVRYWVCSSRVSLWRGQEEDIVADIVQEAITSTFLYASKYSSWVKEGETVSCGLLKHLGRAIAYKQYQDLKHQDSQFVYTRPRR